VVHYDIQVLKNGDIADSHTGEKFLRPGESARVKYDFKSAELRLGIFDTAGYDSVVCHLANP